MEPASLMEKYGKIPQWYFPGIFFVFMGHWYLNTTNTWYDWQYPWKIIHFHSFEESVLL